MNTELSIIIVDYKSFDFTSELISDLEKRLLSVKFEIIVVDNNSGNETVKKLRKLVAEKKNLKIAKAKRNMGFGAGNNLGAKIAKGEYLLLLNPDIHLIDNSIEKMLDFLSRHSEIGALSPLLYQKDGKTLQKHFFGNFQSLVGITIKRWQGKEANLNADFFYTDMVSAATLMIKRELFEKVDGFDQNFFMYIEDDDLCRRISDLGYKNAVLCGAKVIHFEGQSSTSFEKKKYYYKSQNYYWQKHYGPAKTFLMKIFRVPYIWLQNIK